MLALIFCIIFMTAGAIMLTFFLIEKTKRYSVKATIIKTMTSLLFIATSAAGLYHSGHHYLSLFVTLGLLLGLLGDIWLDFKYVYRQHERIFTYAGFSVFGLGHVLYITGMFMEFYQGQGALFVIMPLVVGFVASFANLFLEKLMKLKYGEYKMIVFIYGGLLFSMTCTTFSLLLMTSFASTTLWMMFIGSLFFTLSDLILSGTYFGEGKERPIDIITNGVTYYIAQYLIAFSMFFL